MTDKNQIAARAVEALAELYPDAACALRYEGEGWKLLVMGRLSAQCTDRRVNIVCEDLFRRWPTAADLAVADPAELESVVKPCGLYHVKSAEIRAAMQLLTEKYKGELPRTLPELLEFPGVGRKIANLLLGDLFDIPGIVADTHCIRISYRLGLTSSNNDPRKTENELSALIPPAAQTDFCHRLVQFGRDVCTARAPQCDGCALCDVCESAGNKETVKSKRKG